MYNLLAFCIVELIETELPEDPLEPQLVGRYYACVDILPLFNFNKGKISEYSVQLVASGKKKGLIKPEISVTIKKLFVHAKSMK